MPTRLAKSLPFLRDNVISLMMHPQSSHNGPTWHDCLVRVGLHLTNCLCEATGSGELGLPLNALTSGSKLLDQIQVIRLIAPALSGCIATLASRRMSSGVKHSGQH